MPVTVSEHVAEPFSTEGNQFLSLLFFPFHLIHQVRLFLPVGDIQRDDEVVGNVAIGIEQRTDMALDISVDA